MSANPPRTPLVIGDSHLQTTAQGVVVVRVRGDGPAEVSIRSTRPLTSRWLGGGRPRGVRLGARRLPLAPSGTTTVPFQLSEDHLALLRRMQTMRTTITVTTAAGTCRRRVFLHAPRRALRHR